MDILWLAIVFYSIGLVAILHFRPALMFNENGTWKEFGYQRDSRHTIFPFWLFSVVWAFVSYVLAATIVWSFFPVMSMVSMASIASMDAPEYEDMEYYEETQNSRNRKGSNTNTNTNTKSKPKPGYYVLNTDSTESGMRKYVYYGPEAPQQ